MLKKLKPVNGGFEMINSEIGESVKRFEEENMDLQIDEVYKQIPSGKCDGCGACCNESVRTHYVEFLNIYRYMKKNNLITDEVKKSVMTYYFTEFVQPRECPFRKEGICIIYEVRPLVCRLFGYASKEYHEAGLEKVHHANEEAAEFLMDEYGIEVPEEVIYKTIPYCEKFVPEKEIDEVDRVELSTRLLMMDSEFFKTGVLEDYHLEYGLVQWFVDLWIDVETADDLRIEISKELNKDNTSKTLNDLKNNIM